MAQQRYYIKEIILWSLWNVIAPLLLPIVMVLFWDSYIIFDSKSLANVFQLLLAGGAYTLFGLMIFLNVLCEYKVFFEGSYFRVLPAFIYCVALWYVLCVSSCVFMEDLGLIYDAPSFIGDTTSNGVTCFTLTLCSFAAIGYKYWAIISSDK